MSLRDVSFLSYRDFDHCGKFLTAASYIKGWGHFIPTAEVAPLRDFYASKAW
jgi:hypothetical protein